MNPSKMIDPIDVYTTMREAGISTTEPQCQSPASLGQYRLAYEKTLQYLKPPCHALDWGCGNGHFSHFLTRNGIRTVGYSFVEKPGFLSQEPLFAFQPFDVSQPIKLSFQDSKFDAVFSMGTLEHVSDFKGDEKGSILEIERVLKPGGLFLCFHLPNKYTWIEFVGRTLNKMVGSNIHTHKHLFTHDSFANLLNGTSLTIREAGRYNFLPRNLLSRLPAFLSETKTGLAVIDHLDRLLGATVPFLCQNWFFIVQKER